MAKKPSKITSDWEHRYRGGRVPTDQVLENQGWEPHKPFPDRSWETYAQARASHKNPSQARKLAQVAHTTSIRWEKTTDKVGAMIQQRIEYLRRSSPIVLPTAATLFGQILAIATDNKHTSPKVALDALKFLYKEKRESEQHGYIVAEGQTIDLAAADTILLASHYSDSNSDSEDDSEETTESETDSNSDDAPDSNSEPQGDSNSDSESEETPESESNSPPPEDFLDILSQLGDE